MKLWRVLLLVLILLLPVLSSCDAVNTITGQKRKQEAYQQQLEYYRAIEEAAKQQAEHYQQQIEAIKQMQEQEQQQYQDAMKAYYEAQQKALEEAQKQLQQQAQPQIVVPGQK